MACLGLFGLSAFAISQRIKEIGVRKVLGASTGGLVGLLAKDFFKARRSGCCHGISYRVVCYE
ncbi:MAG: hypothetical protein WDO19_28045 [Bacteroidota bacterium]